MPIRQHVACPSCDTALLRTPGGRCPTCGTAIGDHVRSERAREERIEKVVAVIGTVLVVGVLALTSGLGLIEGVLAYAVAGSIILYLARKTF